jgi:isohexenylglutaconyl-CoA hydratase
MPMIDQLDNLQTLKVDIEEPVVWMTLNRPEVKNAMSFQTATCERPSTRARKPPSRIVLSGEGGTFCAGGDINELANKLSNPVARSTADAINMTPCCAPSTPRHRW